MNKRRPSLDMAQHAFTFDVPAPARRDADLAGLDRMVASGVAAMIKGDPRGRSREEIAGAVSALLSEDVSKWMLDAYASEARGDHNIPAHRLLALIAATNGYEIYDAVIHRIGAALLVGDEIEAAHVGHLEAQMRDLKQRLRAAHARSRPFDREVRTK